MPSNLYKIRNIRDNGNYIAPMKLGKQHPEAEGQMHIPFPRSPRFRPAVEAHKENLRDGLQVAAQQMNNEHAWALLSRLDHVNSEDIVREMESNGLGRIFSEDRHIPKRASLAYKELRDELKQESPTEPGTLRPMTASNTWRHWKNIEREIGNAADGTALLDIVAREGFTTKTDERRDFKKFHRASDAPNYRLSDYVFSRKGVFLEALTLLLSKESMTPKDAMETIHAKSRIAMEACLKNINKKKHPSNIPR